MAIKIVNPADLLALLNQSKALKSNDAAYEMLKRLLGLINQNQTTIINNITADEQGIIDINIFINNLKNLTILTENDERAVLPSSLQLLPGLNLSFDTSIAGRITINAIVSATPPVWIRDTENDESGFIIPGPQGPIGPTGATGPAGSSGNGIMGPPGFDGVGEIETFIIQPQSPGSGIGSPAGTNNDIQFNTSGLFAVDTGVFTYNPGTHFLGVNNIVSQIGTGLIINGSAPVSGVGGAVTITTGVGTGSASGALNLRSGATVTSGNSGVVNLQSGDLTVASSSGLVTISSGAINANGGTIGGVTITTGIATQSSTNTGAGIIVKPGTPANTTTGGSAQAGAPVAITGGTGQSNTGTSLSTTAGNGGALSVVAGAGAVNANSGGNPSTGGAGASLTLNGGAGGNVTNGTTRTGGAGGDVVIAAGVGGTATTTPGLPGQIKIGSPTISNGTVPVLSGSTTSGQLGGAIAGSFVSGVTGVSTVTLTFPKAAVTGWIVFAHNITTPANTYVQTAFTTTTAVISGTTVTNDVIQYFAIGY